MKTFYFLVLFLSGFLVSAQNRGNAEFVEDTFDFGDVNEGDGPIVHEFEFTNTGKAPLIISNVKASCGCTTPGWSKEPVLPGKKGFVKAQYNPLNRPGAFKKSLTITSDGESPRTVLYIQGKVIPRMKTVEEELRIQIGAMRVKNKTVNMGRVTTEKPGIREVDVYNDSDSAFSFTKKMIGPKFIALSFQPETLQPKEKGKIRIAYDPNFKDNLGFQNHSVKFYTDEAEDEEKELNIMATITEYFPPMSAEEKAKAPQLNITDRIYDFGKIARGTSKETKFELVNTGKTSLNIRKIIPNCSCIQAKLDSYDIEPGGSTTLTTTFDSDGRRGNQLKNITIYSNDPASPTQVVSIKAQVENPTP